MKNEQRPQRELPVHTIAGTDFRVDIDQGRLIEAADPQNVIYFSDLTDKGTHYEMLYDLRDKNWPAPVGPMDEQMIDIRLPLMSELDPVGMTLKYGNLKNVLQGRTEQAYIEGLRLLEGRRDGHLPIFMIGITSYTVDIKQHLLLHEDEPAKDIYLGSLWASEDKQHWEGFYDPATSKLLPRPLRTEDLPEKAFLLGVPTVFRLDPVGAAQLYRQDENELLRKYPLQAQYHARITPLNEVSAYTQTIAASKPGREAERKQVERPLRRRTLRL